MSLVKKGDRIETTGLLPGDEDTRPVGSTGTVVQVFNEGMDSEQLDIKWDGSRSMLMLLPGDPFRVIT